jgi:NAD(P)H-flavin reductase/ferredoxin
MLEQVQSIDTAKGVDGHGEFTVRLLDGTSFACRPSETVLLAALRAGINIPYECASGSCGSCKCRLCGGSVVALWPDAPGLSERDRTRGDRILACQSLPQSNLVINVRVGEHLKNSSIEARAAEVISKEYLCEDVIRLILHICARADFLPGQFFILNVPVGTGGRRAYSMANLPNCDGVLEFLIKRKAGGAATRFLFDELNNGDRLIVEGPYGHSYLRGDSERGIVAVAGGAGLAPMLSILRGAVEQAFDRSIDLYFGVNGTKEFFCIQELAALEATCTNVRVHLVLRDQPPPPSGIGCATGLVGNVMLAQESALHEKNLYLAGPSPMVNDILARTVRLGLIPADHVFFDRFV